MKINLIRIRMSILIDISFAKVLYRLISFVDFLVVKVVIFITSLPPHFRESSKLENLRVA